MIFKGATLSPPVDILKSGTVDYSAVKGFG